MRWLRLGIAILLLANIISPSNAVDLKQRLRRPVALALSGDGQWLYTANRNSGSISVVDTSTRSVVEEIDVDGQLSDMAALDDQHLLVLDAHNHQLVLLTGGAADWKVAAKLDLPAYPVRLCVDKTSLRCFITSLWSRAVTMIDLSEVNHQPEAKLSIAKKVELSFEPRELCLDMELKSLIVAGSFANTIAVFDTRDLELLATKRIPGHNIRGLAVSKEGKKLFLAQQELHPLARSTRDDVHWGNMVSNLFVSLSMEDVRNPQADILKRRIVYYLGEPGDAAGDPGAIDVGPTGKPAVVLGGVDELALAQDDHGSVFQRIPVGRHPSAIASSSDGILYVADMFSDSVSIVNQTGTPRIEQVTLGPQPEMTPAQFGETLFFDSRISHDGWMSCHSCHTDGHSSGQLNDNLSDGSFEAPKRVLSLLGVSQTGPWAWNGKVKTLEQQVTRSVQDTMQGPKPSEKQIASLVAYLKTLPAPPALAGESGGMHSDEIARGRELFRSLECQQCHAPPTYTTALAYDIGLADAVGNRQFNPPSLRGAGRRKAFFHDGSVKSLKAVLAEQKHQLNRELSDAELGLLLLFLQSL